MMDILDSLKNQHFAQINFPINQTLIKNAVTAFFRFLDEPDPIKNHIDFTIAPLHRRGDVGYKHRRAEDDVYSDDKDFFHFHPALMSQYDAFISTNSPLADFVLHAKAIWDLVAKTIRDIFQTLEPQFPGVVNKIFATEHPHVLLRFLKYEWQSSGKYLAKPHFDAGSCTLAIAESGPGLRIGSGPADLKLVEHKEQHAIFMLASNYRQLLNTEALCPGWHDVIQLDETRIGKPFARWAVVAFIEAHGVEALPRTETHRWT